MVYAVYICPSETTMAWLPAFPRNRWCEVRRRSQSHRARKRQERDRSCLQTSTMSADITVSDVSLCLFLCVWGQKCQKLWECLRMCWIVSECLKMFQAHHAHLCLNEACRGSWEVPVSCGQKMGNLWRMICWIRSFFTLFRAVRNITRTEIFWGINPRTLF